MAFKSKEDQARYHREVWYPKNKARRIELNKTWKKAVKEKFDAYKATLSCVLCNENESCCLDFHHLEESKKDFSISKGLVNGKSLEQLFKEIEKCVVLCSNCHRKVHAGVAQLAEQHSCKVTDESSNLSVSTTLGI